MNKLFFIIGMRRSGTSILRELILKHPEVNNILFEPYELWHAIRVSHLGRYKNDPYVKKVLDNFRYAPGKYKGAKFALNAGIEAMTWKRLVLVFPEAKFIFIVRSPEQTYKSWIGQDFNSVRGLCSKELYMGFQKQIVNSFSDFTKYKGNDCIINYKNLVENPDTELEKVWKVLDVKRLWGFKKYIQIPKNWSK